MTGGTLQGVAESFSVVDRNNIYYTHYLCHGRRPPRCCSCRTARGARGTAPGTARRPTGSACPCRVSARWPSPPGDRRHRHRRGVGSPNCLCPPPCNCRPCRSCSPTTSRDIRCPRPAHFCPPADWRNTCAACAVTRSGRWPRPAV